MKKLIEIFALAALLPALGFAQHDANQMKYVQLLNPVSSAATTGTAVNVAAYKGNATFVVSFGPATEAVTSSVVLASSATSGGTYVPLTNLAGTAVAATQTGPTTSAVQTVAIDLGRANGYFKVIVAQATTNEIPPVSAVLVAPMKSE